MLTFAATVLSLLVAMLGAGMGLFFWRYVTNLKEQIDILEAKYEPQDQALDALDQRMHSLHAKSRNHEEALRDITDTVDHVIQVQTNQSREIVRLFRREQIPLRFGIEPKNPTVLATPTPKTFTLIHGPRRPSPDN